MYRNDFFNTNIIIYPMHTLPHIYYHKGKLYTKNLTPGQKTHGEQLTIHGNVEYRSWNPYHSKLAAAILNGHNPPPLSSTTHTLYLGAANGTTVSHISDITPKGTIYALDSSPRAMRDLLKLCNLRPNIIPLLADANNPHDYQAQIGHIDLIYQDIAQRNQVDMFLKNMAFFTCKKGILMVKARSIDVTQPPQKIYNRVIQRINETFGTITETIPLHPYIKDHLAIYL